MYRIVYTSPQVIPKEDFDCEERGCNTLSNIHDEYAESMYNLRATGACHAGYVSGTSRVALWSTTAEKAPSLLYYLRGDRPAVNSTKCAEETQPTQMKVYHGDDLWGSVAECTNGPELSSVRQEDDLPTVSRPTVLMTRSDGKVFVVVEETSYYPSFLYSVWTASEMLDRSIQMEHEFHIAASTRLVHAIITGIVHGEVSGKYCFKLVRMWSECGNRCGRTLSPATPFGEHVTSDTVKIENIETIGCGVESNVDTFLCIGCLLALTVVGAAWSLCRRFKGGMDVYNRDELFRAVSSSGGKAGNTPPSAIRVFVRKDHTGNVNVVITDRSNRQVIHPRIRQKGGVRLTEKAKPGPTPIRKKDGENLAEEAEPLPTNTTTRKQGRANLTQEAKPEPMAIWREGAANLMEEGEPAPDSAVPSKCDTCCCGVVIPPGATSHGVDAQCKTCSSGTTADMPRGSRKVWVRGQRTGAARGRPDPTSNYRAFLAMNVSPVPEHFNSRKVCERRHSGSPWEKASQSFFAGECENGRTDSG